MKTVTLKHACAFVFGENENVDFLMRGRMYVHVRTVYARHSFDRTDTICVCYDVVKGDYKAINVDSKKGDSLITII